MITVFCTEKEKRIYHLISTILSVKTNAVVSIKKNEDVIQILEGQEIRSLVNFEEKLIDKLELLYQERKGNLYKAIIGYIEKNLFEYVLCRTFGNQLQAAKILGVNRNTLRAKIRKHNIQPIKWKVL
ncbi:MAG: hypothetical protein N2606_06625 [Candidatus Omnitrophica bacterium]|nr:hypothetical protein [Candidatus Omnitrophota bacterium]